MPSAKASCSCLRRASTFSPLSPCNIMLYAASSSLISWIRMYCARSNSLTRCLRISIDLRSLSGVTVLTVLEMLGRGVAGGPKMGLDGLLCRRGLVIGGRAGLSLVPVVTPL